MRLNGPTPQCSICTVCENEKTIVSLVMAKSKVAPVKKITVPRLELSAAALLARLTNHVIRMLSLSEVPVYLWTDSMVTLGWIKGHPSRWKTYVANRVAEIQSLVPEACWNHLPGGLNPADCASRGLLPSELVNFSLWWDGPEFLRHGSLPPSDAVVVPPECVAEEKIRVGAVVTSLDPEESEILTRFSTLSRLLRVTAWCRRWLPERRPKGLQSSGSVNSGHSPLTADEVAGAEKQWIRLVQAQHYRRELKLIAEHNSISGKSAITGLNPTLDVDGLMRAGDRLERSILTIDEKHPIILPVQSHLSRLIVESCHRRAIGVRCTEVLR